MNRLILGTIVFVLSVAVTHGAAITGKVVGISDGDTLTVLTPAKEQVKVRCTASTAAVDVGRVDVLKQSALKRVS